MVSIIYGLNYTSLQTTKMAGVFTDIVEKVTTLLHENNNSES